MSGYVYLIVEWDKIEKNSYPSKIGVTKGSIENRIKKLQTGNCSNLHMLNFFKSEYPFKLEKMLHRHYQPYRNNGEWFTLTEECVVNFNKTCQEKENIINLLLNENPFYK